jgi:glycosyltransferase involved in cell wall biosynthesis
MRIALVSTPWYPVPPRGYGGIELVVAQLADGLVDRGHEVTLVTAGPRGTRAQHVLSSYPVAQSPRLGSALPEVVHAAYTRAVLADTDIDLVHDHSTAGPLLAPSRTRPTVVTAHNDVTGDFGRILRHLGSDVAPVAISESQRRLTPDLCWAGVVHNGIDVADHPFRTDKDDYVLFLGRLGPTKAPHVAIDVARAAGRRLVLAAKCVEQIELDYFATEIEPRLGPDVEWIGEVGDELKATLLSGAAALIFPIEWEEPFGLVMIEAMACGTPVVALRRGAVEEVVVDGVTGWVCDSAAGLVTALDRVDELDSSACRRHVEQCFSAAGMVDGYEGVYADVLGGRRTVCTPGRSAVAQRRPLPTPSGDLLPAVS